MKCKLLLMVSILNSTPMYAESFHEVVSVYGVVKPARMTNLVAVNNGMVNSISKKVGDSIRFGQVALSAIERETTRGYRTTITGRVAKLHVTEGAAVTPGMPLVTIVDPNKKRIEISFSPAEAKKISVGAKVFLNTQTEPFGEIESISPLVDPDTGGVISYVKPLGKILNLIGDVVPLSVISRTIEGCRIVGLTDMDGFLREYRVEAVSGENVCLKKKNSKEE